MGKKKGKKKKGKVGKKAPSESQTIDYEVALNNHESMATNVARHHFQRAQADALHAGASPAKKRI